MKEGDKVYVKNPSSLVYGKKGTIEYSLGESVVVIKIYHNGEVTYNAVHINNLKPHKNLISVFKATKEGHNHETQV